MSQPYKPDVVTIGNHVGRSGMMYRVIPCMTDAFSWGSSAVGAWYIIESV